MTHRYVSVLAAGLILLGGTAHSIASGTGYQRRALAAVKTAAPPTIDGDLGDACWKDAARADTFIDRNRGFEAQDQTTAYLCYDEANLYVAFYARDSRPAEVVARETIRDHKYSSDQDNEDNVELTLDTFHTHRWDDLTQFSINPLGTLSAKMGGGRASKMEWKGDWTGAARRTADGWTAEMRIPFAILNYPSAGGTVTIGINFSRYQQRTQIQSIWSDTGPQYWQELAGDLTGLQMPARTSRRQLSLLPYVLPGYLDRYGALRSGMDARYSLTPELTAVGSVNPDFATIEGAVEGIAFTRSEQWLPERRPFFLEGRDYINVGADFELGPYFYSRRVETFDTGAKMYGKIGPKDTLGLLSTVRWGERSDTVARYRRDFSPTSSAGFLLVNKTASDDNNTVGVLLHNARWGKFGVNSQWGLSTGRDAGGGAEFVNWTYEDKLNFTSLTYADVAPSFRDADGLIFFNDQRGLHLYHGWGSDWRKGPFRGFHIDAGGDFDWHHDGRPFRRGFGIGGGVGTRKDWSFSGHVGGQRFDDQTDFMWGLNVESGNSNRFRKWGIGFETGKQADRQSTFVGPYGSVRVLRRLDLGYGAAYSSREGGMQQHILTVNYEISPTRSFGGRIVSQNADTNWYVSYRHAGERGTEIFFILGDPNATRFRTMAMTKLVFAM